MKKLTTKTFLAVLMGAGMSQGILQAQNPFYEPGDLVLFFQKPGATESIYVGLGSAANLYRGAAAGPQAERQAINIININTELETAFGTGWASDPNVYAGMIAARSSSTGTNVIDGDQTRTLYASRSRSEVGSPGAASSAPWDFTLSGANTAGATSAIGFTNIFEANYMTQAAVALVSVSKVDTYNPFLDVSLGIQSTAFQAFPGGVQQRGSSETYGTFGPIASPEFMLDLYRIVPRNDSETTGEVSGVQRIGSYEGTVTIDSAGNVSFITHDGDGPPPVDEVPPVITLIGDNPLNLIVGDTFSDPGANVTDNIDAPRTITGTGTVNTAVVGTYTLTYSATDAAGNVATPVERTVNVTAAEDTTPPVITLIGDNPLVITLGGSFSDPGASVTDNVDAPRTITGTGTVDTNTIGDYTITYNATDEAGNAAIPVERTVSVTAPLDTTPPVITLIGSNPINLNVGDSFTDPGANVTDNVDSPRVVFGTGTVNTSVAGSYTLTYTASDGAGNVAIPVTRTVNVLTAIPNLITYTTSVGGRFDLTNLFLEGPFEGAEVSVVGRLPKGLRYNNRTGQLLGYPRRPPAQAEFTVTLPGQDPQTVVLDFAFVPFEPSLIGTHVVQTALGEEITIAVNRKGAATIQIRTPGVRRPARVRSSVSYNVDAEDPSQTWTISVPAQNLEIGFPEIRSLNEAEGSFLGNYGLYDGRALWGYKSTNSVGEITLSRGSDEIKIVGQMNARGTILWTITSNSGRPARVRGLSAADGIGNISADIPNIGSIHGMLRVDEELDEDGTPTGQLVMSILQGFADWTPVQYDAP